MFDAKIEYRSSISDTIDKVTYIQTSSYDDVSHRYFTDITMAKGTTLTIYPYISSAVKNRYQSQDVTYLFNSQSLTGQSAFIRQKNNRFTVNNSVLNAFDNPPSMLSVSIAFYCAYTVTIERTLDGELNTNELNDATEGKQTDLLKFVEVHSETHYGTVNKNNYEREITDHQYLSFYNKTPDRDEILKGELNEEECVFSDYYVSDRLVKTYPIHRNNRYSIQTLSTSVITQIDGLVFYGWYLNGFLYSQQQTITFGSTTDGINGFVLIYDATNTVVGITQLRISGSGEEQYYTFSFGSYTASISRTNSLENIYGEMTGSIGSYNYIYIPSDNIKITAAYGFYTQVTYDTDSTNTTGTQDTNILVSSIISGNTLRYKHSTEAEAAQINSKNEFDLIEGYPRFETTPIIDGNSLGDGYSLSYALGSYTITNNNNSNSDDAVFVQGSTNMYLSGGHTLGYRFVDFVYRRRVATISVSGNINNPESGSLPTITYHSGSLATNELLTQPLSQTDAVAYLPLSSGLIVTEILVIANYEKIYNINAYTSTIGNFGVTHTVNTNLETEIGGTLKVKSYQSQNSKIKNESGSFFSNIYDCIEVICEPNNGYTTAGLFINGIYLSAQNLGIDTFGLDTEDETGLSTPLKINLRMLFMNNREFDVDGKHAFNNNITVEARFAKKVTVSITMAINNTSNKTVLDNVYHLNASNKCNFDINITLSNQYNSLVFSSTSSLKLNTGAKFDPDATYYTDSSLNNSITFNTSNIQEYWETDALVVPDVLTSDDLVNLNWYLKAGKDLYVKSTTVYQNTGTNPEITKSIWDGDESELKTTLTVPYGTCISFSIVSTSPIASYQSSYSYQFYFNGWYIYDDADYTLDNSLVMFNNEFKFYATQDNFYRDGICASAGDSMNFVAKFSNNNNSSYVLTPTYTTELYNSSTQRDVAVSNLLSLGDDLEDNIITFGGNDYMFAGWWLKVNDSQPSLFTRFILVSIVFAEWNGSSWQIPSELNKADSYVARFVQVKTMTINLPNGNDNLELSSGKIVSNLFYGFYYTQLDIHDNRMKATSSIGQTMVANKIFVPIETYMGWSTTIIPQEGFYYIIQSVRATYSPSHDHFPYFATGSGEINFTFSSTNALNTNRDPASSRLSTTASYSATKDIYIESINKAGYPYDINTKYNILSAVDNTFTISIVTTIVNKNGNTTEHNGNYVTAYKTLTGTDQKTTFSPLEPTVYLKRTDIDAKNYTFAGYYVNGVYVDRSFNASTTSRLAIYLTQNEDVVIEARYIQNVTVTIEMTSAGGSITDVNLGLNINISNIYHTQSSDLQIQNGNGAPIIVYGSTNTISNITALANNNKIIIVAPYGTRLYFEANRENARWFNSKTNHQATNLLSNDNTLLLFCDKDYDNASPINLDFNNSYSSTGKTIQYKLINIDGTETTITSTSTPELYSSISSTPQIYTYSSGRKFVFVGWYRNNTLVSITPGSQPLDINGNPYQSGTYTAKYVEYKTIEIAYSDISSISVKAINNLAYYGVPQTTDNYVLSPKFIDSEKRIISIPVTKSANFYLKNIKTENEYKFLRDDLIPETGAAETTFSSTLTFNIAASQIIVDTSPITTIEGLRYTFSTNTSESANKYMSFSKYSSNKVDYYTNIQNDIHEDSISFKIDTNFETAAQITVQAVDSNRLPIWDLNSSVITISSNINQNNLDNKQFFANEIRYVNIEGTIYYLYNSKYYKTINSERYVDGKSYSGITMISADGLTIYTFSDEKSESSLNITETTATYIKYSKVVNGETVDVSKPILTGVFGKYFTGYSTITVTLQEEYQTDSFAGFMISPDGSTNDMQTFFDVSEIGYSFTTQITGSVYIYAIFNQSSGVGGVQNGGYSADPSDMKTVTITAPDNYYIENIQYYIGGSVPSSLYMNYNQSERNRFVEESLGSIVFGETEDSQSTKYVDSFGQVFYTSITFKVPNSYSEPTTVADSLHIGNNVYTYGQNYRVQLRPVIILNISITQNEEVISGQSAEIKMFYPAEHLSKTFTGLFSTMTYGGVETFYTTNQRIITYLESIAQILKVDEINRELELHAYNEINSENKVEYNSFGGKEIALTGEINFDDTMVVNENGTVDFFDGFRSQRICRLTVTDPISGDPVEVSAETTLISGEFVANEWNRKNFAFIYQNNMEDTMNNNLIYNYQTEGKLRIYIHPEYYNPATGEYDPEKEQSSLSLNIPEDVFVTRAFRTNTRGVTISGPEKDEYMSRSLPAKTNTGVYYYEFTIHFSEAFSLEFISPYLSFDYYGLLDGSGHLTKFEDHEFEFTGLGKVPGITLKTQNSAYSMSYDEYVKLLVGGQLDLHCFAIENTKKTTLEFDYDNARINLQIKIGSDPGEIFASEKTEISFSDGDDMREEIKLISTSNSSNIIYISKNSYYDNNNGKYYMELIYGQDLIVQQAQFYVTLADFEPVQRTSDPSKGSLLLNISDDFTEAYNCTDAYCKNSSQAVQFVTTPNSAQIIWQLTTDFANDNIIELETQKYYRVLYSTNQVFGDSRFSLTYKYGDEPETTLLFGDTAAERYVYAYVRDGSIVKIKTIKEETVSHGFRVLRNVANGDFINENIINLFISADSEYMNKIPDKYLEDYGKQTVRVPSISLLGSESIGTIEYTTYTFMPKSNSIYLSDYISGDSEESRVILAILAPNNTSKFALFGDSSANINTYLDGSNFNVIAMILNKNSSEHFIQQCIKDTVNNKENDEAFANYSIYEKNGYLFISDDSMYYPVSKFDFNNFDISVDFSLYVFATQAVVGGEIQDIYPIQYLILAKAKAKKIEALLSIKKATVLPANPVRQETDYIYKSTYFFVDESLDDGGNPVATYGFTSKGFISDSGISGNSGKILSLKANETVHAMSLYKSDNELYYLIDDKVYLIYDKTGENKQEFYDLSQEVDPRSRGMFFSVDYKTYSITIYYLSMVSGSYKFVNGVLYNGSSPESGYTSKFDENEGIIVTLKTGRVISGFSLSVYNDDTSGVIKGKTYYLKDSKRQTDEIKKVEQLLQEEISKPEPNQAEVYQNQIDVLKNCYTSKTIIRETRSFDNKNAYLEDETVKELENQNETYSQNFVKIKYDQVTVVENTLNTYIIDGIKYYLVGDVLSANYENASRSTKNVYYNLTIKRKNSGATRKYRSAGYVDGIQYLSDIEDQDGNTVYQSGNIWDDSYLPTRIYELNGLFYTDAACTVLLENDGRLADLDSKEVKAYYGSSYGSAFDALPELNSTEKISRFNTVELDGVSFFVGGDLRLYKAFPYTQHNRVKVASLVSEQGYTQEEYDYLKVNDYKIYPNFITYMGYRFSFYNSNAEVDGTPCIIYFNSEFPQADKYLALILPNGENEFRLTTATLSGSTYVSNHTPATYKLSTKMTVDAHTYKDTSKYIGANIVQYYNTVIYNNNHYTKDSIDNYNKLVKYKFNTNEIYYNYETKTFSSNGVANDISENQVICKERNIRYQVLNQLNLSDPSQILSYKLYSVYDSVYKKKLGTNYELPNDSKLVIKGGSATITSISAKVLNGYYIKGFIIVSDYSSASSTWLGYVLDASGSTVLNGLQTLEYYSGLTLQKYISIDYNEIDPDAADCPIRVEYRDGKYSYIYYDIEIPISGNCGIYAVYAPVVYTIDVKKIDISQLKNIEDATINVYNRSGYDDEKNYGLYEQLFAENAEVTNSDAAGKVKGTLLAEHGNYAWLTARSNNGSEYLGYSIGKQEDNRMVRIDTAISTSAKLTSEQVKTIQANSKNNDNVLKEIVGEELYYNTTTYIKNLICIKNSPQTTSLSSTANYFVGTNSTNDAKFVIVNKVGNQQLTFPSSNNVEKNNIIIGKFTDNLTLYCYFNAISYNLVIELTEEDMGSYNDGSGTENDAYISYTEAYLEQEGSGWKNPASRNDVPSKQYTFSVGGSSFTMSMQNDNMFYRYCTDEEKYATGSAAVWRTDVEGGYEDNGGKVAQEVTTLSSGQRQTDSTCNTDDTSLWKSYSYKAVVADDNLVYTLFDNYGTLITSKFESGTNSVYYATPTSIMEKSIDFEASREAGFLIYKENNSTTGVSQGPENLSRYIPSIVRITIPQDKSSLFVNNAKKVDNVSGIYTITDTAGNLWVIKPVQYYEITSKDTLPPNRKSGSGGNVMDGSHNDAGAGSSDWNYGYTFSSTSNLKHDYFALYLTIPYNDANNTNYWEYSGRYFDEKTNNSAGLKKNSADATKTISTIDKYIYSVTSKVGLFEQLAGIGNPIEKTSLSKCFAVQISDKDDIVFDATTRIAYYKNSNYIVATNFLFNGLTYSYANPDYELTTVKQALEAGSKAGATDEEKSLAERYMQIIIYENDVDDVARQRPIYNISSTNSMGGVTDRSQYMQHIAGTEKEVRLKSGLFTVTVDSVYMFNSEDIASTSSKVIAKVDGSDEESKTIYCKLFVESKQLENHIKTTIRITLKIYCSDGQMPMVEISKPKTNSKNSNSDKNSYLTMVGQSVSYEYGAEKDDSIYKARVSEESMGTRYTQVITDANDSNYMTTNSTAGFFGHLFDSGAVGEQADNFSMPNLNVRVNLVYSYKLMYVDTKINVTKNNSPNDDVELLRVNGHSFYDTDSSNSAQNEQLSQIFTRVLRSNNSGGDRRITPLFTYYSFIYKSANIYILSDAATVITALCEIITRSNNIDNIVDAIKYYAYITTYNPLDFDTKANIDYLFDDSHTTQGMYKYSSLYKLIERDAASKSLLFTFPKPEDTGGKFVKINRIDIATAAKSAIDCNFVRNYIRQSDLVLTVVEEQQKYTNQYFLADKIGILFWGEMRQDAIGINAKNYYLSAKIDIDAQGVGKGFTIASANVGNANELFTDNPKEQFFAPDEEKQFINGRLNLGKECSYYYLLSKVRSCREYFSMSTSSAAFSKTDFYDTENDLKQITFRIMIKDDISHAIITKIHGLNPDDYKSQHDFWSTIIAIFVNIVPIVGQIISIAALVSRIQSAITAWDHADYVENLGLKFKYALMQIAFTFVDGCLKCCRVSESDINNYVREYVKETLK